MTKIKNESLHAALGEGDLWERCIALREACPCRNGGTRDDLALWREVFERALKGGRRERRAAAHAIGTLTEKAKTSDEWRGLLHDLRDDLDALLRDPRASQQVLGTMKRHGHAHRGAARKNYRRRRKALDLATPEELAAWVNRRWQLSKSQTLTAQDAGVRRLFQWLRHRVDFQPERATKESELAKRATRYLPMLLGCERQAA